MYNFNKHILKDFNAIETIVLALPEMAYVFNLQGEMIIWNKNVEKILGYSGNELQTKNISEFQDPPDRERVLKKFLTVFEKGTEQTIEYNLLTKSSEKIPCLGTGSLVIIKEEKFLIGIAINISKQKEAEKKLNIHLEEIKQLKDRLQAENVYLKEDIKDQLEFKNFFGKSESILNVLHKIKHVAKTVTPVLLNGENGIKKESFARELHELSNRNEQSFVRINCITLDKNSLTSFNSNILSNGSEKKIGRFDIAQNGTLFLDDVNEFPLELQAKLLETLQEFNSPENSADVRVIASTSQDLEELVKQKRFLKDLYFYFNVFPINIPPLRERISDIPFLVDYYIKLFNQKYAKNISTIPKNSMVLLQNYSWPGNLRELENVIERAVILSNSSFLKMDEIIKSKAKKNQNNSTLEELETDYIIKILHSTFWRVSGDKGAAKILGLHPETLRSRMRKLGIKKS